VERRILKTLVAGALAAALPALPAAAASDRVPAPSTTAGMSTQIKLLPRATAGGLQLAPKADGLDCVAQVIECGQTVLSDITTQDCEDRGTYFDVFYFDGVAGETVTATMSSTAFDPYLYLFYPDPTVFLMDDNSGPGNAARIVHTLEETSQDWSLSPTPFDPGVTGPYTLTLECAAAPPGPGFFTDPQFSDFRFKVEIEPTPGDVIDGIHLTDCQEDTVCVAGALPDRPELYIRILGPRPNGYLWPTLVRFTPSKVTVQIQQISTGDLQTYELDAVGPGDENLSGLQDRTGFLP